MKDPEHTVANTTARLIDVLDRARRKRGESKADVARGAGLGEPAVRRLFSGGHANPTVKTVDAVAAHLGFRLSLEPAEQPRTAPTHAGLRTMADQIERIVGDHGGCDVRVFGSVARGDARADSDIDLLIEVGPGIGMFELGAMEDELSVLLGRPVDVVASAHGRLARISDEAVPLR